MRKLTAAVAVLSTAYLATAAAEAATLQQVQGNVQINRGNGYQPVRGGAVLQPGDIVVVGEGATAVVSYGYGCASSVPAGSIVTISAQSPCGGTGQGQGGYQQPSWVGANPPGGAVGVGALGAGGITTPMMIGGGILAAGVGLSAYQQSRNNRNNRRPTSP